MESKCVATGTYPLHICDRWQFDRLCRKKNYEPAVNRVRLALGNHLYPSGYYYLAGHGVAHQHSFWSVQVFFKLYTKIGRKDGAVKTAESKKSKLKSKNPGCCFLNFDF